MKKIQFSTILRHLTKMCMVLVYHSIFWVHLTVLALFNNPPSFFSIPTQTNLCLNFLCIKNPFIPYEWLKQAIHPRIFNLHQHMHKRLHDSSGDGTSNNSCVFYICEEHLIHNLQIPSIGIPIIPNKLFKQVEIPR